MTSSEHRWFKGGILLAGALVALLGPLGIERDMQRLDDEIRKAEASADESQRILDRTKVPFEKFSAESAIAKQEIQRLRSARPAEAVVLKREIRTSLRQMSELGCEGADNTDRFVYEIWRSCASPQTST